MNICGLRDSFNYGREIIPMKKAVIFVLVALAIPTSVAFAKSPKPPHNHGKSHPMVMYVLKGTLSSYSAATTGVDGQISITVKHSNFHGRALRGQTLTFTTSMQTKVTFRHGATQITDGARGIL